MNRKSGGVKSVFELEPDYGEIRLRAILGDLLIFLTLIKGLKEWEFISCSWKGSTMKRLFAFLLMVSFLVSACTFNVDVLTPPVQSPTALATQNISTAIASPVATTSATATSILITPSVTPVVATFYGVIFTSDAGSPDGKIFSSGTKQIFAVWNYVNMRPGMTVRREWYLNGELWLTREEAWDFAKYGANGTVRDVSIHDFDAGLTTGIYELRIYIDNVIQPIGTADNGQPDTKARFEIRADNEAQAGAASPDFQWAIEVFGEQRIVLEDKYQESNSHLYGARSSLHVVVQR